MMSDINKRGSLNVEDVAEIRQQARQKLCELNKLNDIIGVQVFALLGLHAHVLYYPLDNDGPWGFTCLGDGKPFIAINTAIAGEKQVFAAAHELYHIWFDNKTDFIPSSVLGEIDEQGITFDIAELKANRFAAEFLVEEGLLRQEMHIYSIIPGKVIEKDILMLANLFSVPYETMVKRLFELDAIPLKDQDMFLSQTSESINNLRRRYSFPMPVADNRIALDALAELAVKQYEKKKITFEKLTYLLSMCGLEPEAVGIPKPLEHVRPSDDELDSIMEE